MTSTIKFPTRIRDIGNDFYIVFSMQRTDQHPSFVDFYALTRSDPLNMSSFRGAALGRISIGDIYSSSAIGFCSPLSV